MLFLYNEVNTCKATYACSKSRPQLSVRDAKKKQNLFLDMLMDSIRWEIFKKELCHKRRYLYLEGARVLHVFQEGLILLMGMALFLRCWMFLWMMKNVS